MRAGMTQARSCLPGTSAAIFLNEVFVSKRQPRLYSAERVAMHEQLA
jgi:hypothetical protein